MAKIYGQLEKAQFENLASDPATTALGYVYYNIVSNTFRIRTLTGWETAITGPGGAMAVSQGGTGAGTFPANALLAGNGTSAFQTISPGAAGRVLMSDGTNWTSQAILPVAVSSQTASYTLTNADETVKFDATSGSLTATLPSAAGISGKVFRIKKIDGSANTVTIATTAAQTMDGRASGAVVLRSIHDFIAVQSDGANWIITAKKETEVLSSTSGTYAVPVGYNEQFLPMSNNFVTLSPGLWRLNGAFQLHTGGAANTALRDGSGFYAAPGSSTAAPAALTGVVGGFTTLNSIFGTGGDIVLGLPASVLFTSSNLEITLLASIAMNVYIVPKIYNPNNSACYVRCGIMATRVW